MDQHRAETEGANTVAWNTKFYGVLHCGSNEAFNSVATTSSACKFFAADFPTT